MHGSVSVIWPHTEHLNSWRLLSIRAFAKVVASSSFIVLMTWNANLSAVLFPIPGNLLKLSINFVMGCGYCMISP